MLLEGFKAISIYEVEKLRDIFLDALTQVDSLALDMSGISKVDMVGIQLLISLVKTAEAESKSVTFVNITEHVLGQIEESRCRTVLGLDA